jgi:mannose-1-phosphate guanylyltransferase
VAAKSCWVITNQDAQGEIARKIPRLVKRQIVAESVGRNTAPAIGLAAFILLRRDPQAVIGMFPSDNVVEDEQHFRQVLERGIKIAAAGDNIVVLEVAPLARKQDMATSKPERR